MPYLVTKIDNSGKRTTIYTISNPHSNMIIGKVIIHGRRRRRWSFTSETGSQLSTKSHARQINGMRDIVRAYHRSPYPMPTPVTENKSTFEPTPAKDLWGPRDDGDGFWNEESGVLEFRNKEDTRSTGNGFWNEGNERKIEADNKTPDTWA
jgi:hypothetical protein